MLIQMCSAKIHRARVTEANLHYVGSVTIDSALLRATGIRPYQMVQITNCANGVLWRTYAVAGPEGRGDLCLNGPPARHFAVGDCVIVLADALLDPSEVPAFRPLIAFVDDNNRLTRLVRGETPFALDQAD